MTTAFVTLANEAFLAEKGSVSCEDQVELLFKIYEHLFFFFIYIYNLHFLKQKVYSRRISKRTWDPTQNATTKQTNS